MMLQLTRQAMALLIISFLLEKPSQTTILRVSREASSTKWVKAALLVAA